MAERTAGYLSKKPIVAVYSSRLTLAHETAEIIATKHHLPVVINRRLLDIRTPLQGKPLSYARSFDGNFYQPSLIRAGAERLSEVFSRMDRFLRNKVALHAGKHIAVVSHGDLLMTVYDAYSGRPWPKRGYSFKNWYVPQATGFIIEFDEGNNPLSLVKFP